jgi:hypothetical protein
MKNLLARGGGGEIGFLGKQTSCFTVIYGCLGLLKVFSTMTLYSSLATFHNLAACVLRGESTFGSARSDWMDCKMVLTL